MAAQTVSGPHDPAARAYDVTEPVAVIKRISWGAVFAGVVIVLVIQLVLSLLGLGIGLATIEPATGDTPSAGTASTATAIYGVIASLIALFAGGYVASRLAGMPLRLDGLLHGLVTFALATLVLFYLLTTTLSSLIGGAFGAIGSVVQAAGQTAQAAASQPQAQGPLADLRRQIQNMLGQASRSLQQATGTQNLGDAVERVVRAGQTGVSPQERQAAIDAIANQTGMSRQEAEARLQQLQDAYAKAQQQAREAAEATASAASKASFWSFVALVIGAVAAAIGGWLGAPHDLRAEPVRRQYT